MLNPVENLGSSSRHIPKGMWLVCAWYAVACNPDGSTDEGFSHVEEMSVGVQESAPEFDAGSSYAGDIEFDYDQLRVPSQPGRLMLRVKSSVLSGEGPFSVRITGRRMTDDPAETTVTVTESLQLAGDGLASVFSHQLEPGHVYALKVRLAAGGADLTGDSPFYFVMVPQADKLSLARADIFNHAVYEWAVIGKRESRTVDQNRYHAGNAAWCSEFYAWVTDQHLTGMGRRTWVGDLSQYFEKQDQMLSGDRIAAAAGPGDYLAMGGTQHSGMFVAFNPRTNVMWTLDGNWGDKIMLVKRQYRSGYFRLGSLKSTMVRRSASVQEADLYAALAEDSQGLRIYVSAGADQEGVQLCTGPCTDSSWTDLTRMDRQIDGRRIFSAALSTPVDSAQTLILRTRQGLTRRLSLIPAGGG